MKKLLLLPLLFCLITTPLFAQTYEAVADTAYISPYGSVWVDVLANDNNVLPGYTIQIPGSSSYNMVYENKVYWETFIEDQTIDSVLYTVYAPGGVTQLGSGMLYFKLMLGEDTFRFEHYPFYDYYPSGQIFCDQISNECNIKYVEGLSYDSLSVNYGDSIKESSPNNGDQIIFTHKYSAPRTYLIQIKLYKDGVIKYLRLKEVSIGGKVKNEKFPGFYDGNRNNIRDPFEPELYLNNNNITITNQLTNKTYSSWYYFYNIDGGPYTAQIDPDPEWLLTDSSDRSFTVNDSCFTGEIGLGLYRKSDFRDVRIQLYHDGRVRPGENASFNARYANIGTDNATGTVSFDYDPNKMTFAISSPPPSISVPGKLTYDYSFIPSGTQYDILIDFTLQTPPQINIGDTIFISANIDKPDGDDSLENNNITSYSIVRGSFDPNEKVVFPAGLGAKGEILTGTELTYTVYFQNTGTDYAKDIKVRDTLSDYLDPTTLQVITSSHNMVMEKDISGKALVFDFKDIFLLDSNENEPLSHGFLVYKIKTKNALPVGTEIKNTASIYFDFNPPIVTNTTLNTISLLSSVSSTAPQINSIVIPNPVSEQAMIGFSNPNNKSSILEIFDINGRLIQSANSNANNYLINRSNLIGGIYFYRITVGDAGVANGKFIVE